MSEQTDPRVLIVHRRYSVRGGEDVFIDDILMPSLKEAGVRHKLLVLPPLSSLIEIIFMMLGLEKLRPSFHQVKGAAQEFGATHVIFNNFVPTVSLALPRWAKANGMKTIWWLHNMRVFCANGLAFNGKEKCQKCLTQGSRWAFFQNCHSRRWQSFIYACAYRFQRPARLIFPYIDTFICNSDFTSRNLLMTADHVGVKPHFNVIRMPVPKTGSTKESDLATLQKIPKPFYLFLGRVSYEKGADIFVQWAEKYPYKTFVMAGDGPLLVTLKSKKLSNLVFLGRVTAEKDWLFANAEALLVPSRVPETTSLVILESAPHGTPVVYPRGGGAEETFKLFSRAGCPLDEFRGQSFVKKAGQTQGISTLLEFQDRLKNVFAT